MDDHSDHAMLPGIVGRDPKMLELAQLIRRVAPFAVTVLITGESGTGKDLVARALHRCSPRRDRPFVAINCAAIPENLLESELFGHERGAFTGADRRYRGRIEQAEGGTLFFDEIGELAFPLQAKLLRFLQSGEVARLGGRDTVPVEVRVVAATGSDLSRRVDEGRFHAALFYRLDVVPVVLPPLRRRAGDVALLVEHFRRRYARLYGAAPSFDPGAIALLERQPFPGNVRELENLVHRLVITAKGASVTATDLDLEAPAAAGPEPELRLAAPRTFGEVERLARRVTPWLRRHKLRLAEQAVRDAGGDVALAAERLGLHRVSLYRLLRRRRAL